MRAFAMRRVGIYLIVIGALVALVSLTAELIGLSDDPGFQVGPRQASGIALGLLITLVGVVMLMREKSG